MTVPHYCKFCVKAKVARQGELCPACEEDRRRSSGFAMNEPSQKESKVKFSSRVMYHPASSLDGPFDERLAAAIREAPERLSFLLANAPECPGCFLHAHEGECVSPGTLLPRMYVLPFVGAKWNLSPYDFGNERKEEYQRFFLRPSEAPFRLDRIVIVQDGFITGNGVARSMLVDPRLVRVDSIIVGNVLQPFGGRVAWCLPTFFLQIDVWRRAGTDTSRMKLVLDGAELAPGTDWTKPIETLY